MSETALREALDALAVRYPALALHGVVGDFAAHLDRLPRDDGGAPGPADRRLVAFLGGTIGNLEPGAAGGVPRAACAVRCGRASTCCSARRWSRTRRCSSRRTTTPPG